MVSYYGTTLYYASDRLRNNYDIVMKALDNNTYDLYYIKNNKNLEVNYGDNIKYGDKQLNTDRYLHLNKSPLKYASLELRDNANSRKSLHMIYSIIYVSKRFRCLDRFTHTN